MARRRQSRHPCTKVTILIQNDFSPHTKSRFEEEKCQRIRKKMIENYIGNTVTHLFGQIDLAAARGLGPIPFPTVMMHHPAVVIRHLMRKTKNDKENRENGFVIATGFTTDTTPTHTLPLDGNIIDGITAMITTGVGNPRLCHHPVIQLKHPP
jgi:hypothetical protein